MERALCAKSTVYKESKNQSKEANGMAEREKPRRKRCPSPSPLSSSSPSLSFARSRRFSKRRCRRASALIDENTSSIDRDNSDVVDSALPLYLSSPSSTVFADRAVEKALLSEKELVSTLRKLFCETSSTRTTPLLPSSSRRNDEGELSSSQPFTLSLVSSVLLPSLFSRTVRLEGEEEGEGEER